MAAYHTIHIALNVLLLLGLLSAIVTFTWDGPITRGGAGQYTFKNIELGATFTFGKDCDNSTALSSETAGSNGYIDQNISSLSSTITSIDHRVKSTTVIDFKGVFEDYPANGHVTEMFVVSWVFLFVSFFSVVFVFYWMFLYGKDKRKEFESKHTMLIKSAHIAFYLLILALSVVSIALMAMATGDDYENQMDKSSLAEIDGVKPYDSDNDCWNDDLANVVWSIAMSQKCTPSGIGDDPCNMPTFLLLFYSTTSVLMVTSLACLVFYMMSQGMWPFSKTVRVKSSYDGGKESDASDFYDTSATSSLVF